MLICNSVRSTHDAYFGYWEVLMATPLGPKQIVSFEELLVSHVVYQEALTRLLVEKGIFTKDEVLEMVKAVDREMGQEGARMRVDNENITLGEATRNIH